VIEWQNDKSRGGDSAMKQRPFRPVAIHRIQANDPPSAAIPTEFGEDGQLVGIRHIRRQRRRVQA